MHYVLGWSGGKDSSASAILLYEHKDEILKPGDKVTLLFVEVMFDLKNNVSGHNPDVIKFIHEKKKVFESWGFNVEILRAEKDFLDFFHHKMGKCRKHPEHEGMTYGFPGAGNCGVKRDLKLKPINVWNKAHKDEEIRHFVGIAIDEPKRLESLHEKGDYSLLEQYNMTEADAFALCEKYDMLSPQYSMVRDEPQKNRRYNADSEFLFPNFPKTMKRDGCWFCPYAKTCEHEAIYKANPQAYEQYVALESEPELAYPKYFCHAKETLHEELWRIKDKIRREQNVRKHTRIV